MKKPVLSDHKKKGQRFIPPALAAMPMHEISYVNQLLPEILWLALLRTQVGNTRAIELALNFMTLVKDSVEKGDFRNFALIGRFNELGDSTKKGIANKVALSTFGDELIKLLEPLLNNYPKCPLDFLKPNVPTCDRSTSIRLMQTVVETHINRNSYNAAVIQAMTALIRQAMGGLHYSARVEKPDFSSFIASTEDSDWERIGSRARLAAQSELMPMGQSINDEWARYFWNTGVVNSECDLNDR